MDVHPTKNGIYRYWPIPIWLRAILWRCWAPHIGLLIFVLFVLHKTMAAFFHTSLAMPQQSISLCCNVLHAFLAACLLAVERRKTAHVIWGFKIQLPGCRRRSLECRLFWRKPAEPSGWWWQNALLKSSCETSLDAFFSCSYMSSTMWIHADPWDTSGVEWRYMLSWHMSYINVVLWATSRLPMAPMANAFESEARAAPKAKLPKW